MGFTDGNTARSFPALLGYGTGLAITMSGFDFVGGLWGYKKDSEVDEFERRTQLRTNYRQSGEETIAQLGEGRGMFSTHKIATATALTIPRGYRTLRPWIRRETAAKNQGRIRL